ncbi:LytR/AlgR family response regulator transcription factor [Flagellimonas onchidii]|uniref:LytR/AlgR family response regulator transcription factor n=1 Tax=Flagellimonas onchidii TaxID=2562684 RepID=UPI0010A63974|nr:LytTR family DNA-binding domain-containing protein [Allomuricauda onchidii]
MDIDIILFVDETDVFQERITCLLKDYNVIVNYIKLEDNVQESMFCIASVNHNALIIIQLNTIRLERLVKWHNEFPDTEKLNFIFISPIRSLSPRLIQYEPVAFILEPLDFNEFDSLFKKGIGLIIENHTQRKSFKNAYASKQINKIISVSGSRGIEMIKTQEILYLKSDGRYTEFIMPKRRVLASKNIKEYEELLPPIFFRVHHSYIVNLNNVDFIDKSDGSYCFVTNGDYIPISKRKMNKLELFLSLKKLSD